MPDGPYAAHALLVSPALGACRIWQLLFGLITVVFVAVGLNSAVQAAIFTFAPEFWTTVMMDPDLQGSTPASLLILLFSFLAVTIGVAVTVQLIHRRAPQTVLGPPGLAVVQFGRVLRWLLVIGVILIVLPPYDLGKPLDPNLRPGLWLALLPVSLLAVLVQTSAEEVLFRGYIQQQLAARFSSPVIWMGVPSALFAAGHYIPLEAGDNALLIVAWSGIFGILMADLTARAGSLGPAIAVHFANNITALLIVSVPDSLTGLSLFTLPYSLADAEAVRIWLPVDFALMGISWLAARVAIRR